jgi:hypothetical protein
MMRRSWQHMMRGVSGEGSEREGQLLTSDLWIDEWNGPCLAV